MLDIKRIRENPEQMKELLRRRQKSYDAEIEEIVALDARRRALLADTESRKAEQNRVSKQIPAIKKQGGDASALLAEMKTLADTLKTDAVELARTEEALSALLLSVPNTPHPDVPVGRDAEDNVEVRRHGDVPSFDFTPRPHWEIGEALGILDPGRAAKVTGARFHFYRAAGAALERAVISFYLDRHTRENGYTELLPPLFANTASMTGTGQLPKFAEDMFHIENTDYYLIPTAEVPVTNYHRDEILDSEQMPVKYCAYSSCFRAEAGSAGRDTRGLIRQHQFNKVELVKLSAPETSYDELESLTHNAESVLSALGLPYRVVALCTGDMGFSSAKTYDIEVYMPSYGRYLEISSCSNFEDFQARRANIRMRTRDSKPVFVHTLNGSGVAIGRTVAAILENYQNADGSVTVPEALRPYMGGLARIEKA